VHKYLSGEIKKEPDFSAVPCESTGGNGHKLKYRRFHLNIFIYLFNHCNSDEAPEPAAQKGCGVFNLGDIQTLTIGPEQSALPDSASS